MSVSTHYYYLLVNLGCLLVPFVFSFHPRIRFDRQWKAFFPGVLAMMLLFIPWDILFTASGVWGFNEKYTTGIFIGNLPLEEWLFFICIPYACLFTYHCISRFTEGKKLSAAFDFLPAVIIAWCLLAAVAFHDRQYTFLSHLLCALLLLLHRLLLKSTYIGRFMLTFIILLLPFIISNGILTGVSFWNYPLVNTDPDGIAEKIVWYNNMENLQLRIFSMPLDDISYGLTMLLLVTTVYEWRKGREIGRVR